METNKPFTCKEDGKVRWFSPSIATVCSVCCWNDKGMDPEENLLFLFEKRGPGCPDNVGLYCMPCGYYDFADQYIRGGAVRELLEETGLVVNPGDLHFCGIDDGPNTNNGNITLRYMTILEHEMLRFIMSSRNELSTITRGGESGEVEKYVLFDLKYVLRHPEEFCFGHDKLAELIALNLDRILCNRFYSDNYCEVQETKRTAKTLISEYKLKSMSKIRKFLKKAAIMADVVKEELTEAVKDAREMSKSPKESIKDFVETVKNPKSTREDLVGGAKEVLKKTGSAVKEFVMGDDEDVKKEYNIRQLTVQVKAAADPEDAETIQKIVDQILRDRDKSKIEYTDKQFEAIWESIQKANQQNEVTETLIEEWLMENGAGEEE